MKRGSKGVTLLYKGDGEVRKRDRTGLNKTGMKLMPEVPVAC